MFQNFSLIQVHLQECSLKIIFTVVWSLCYQKRIWFIFPYLHTIKWWNIARRLISVWIFIWQNMIVPLKGNIKKKKRKWKFNVSAPMFLLGLNLLDISEIAPRLFIVYLVNENFVVTWKMYFFNFLFAVVNMFFQLVPEI